MQLGNYKLRQIDIVSISIFGVAAFFLLLYKIGVQYLFAINTQLIAVFLIGLGSIVSAIRSWKLTRENINTFDNNLLFGIFFFGGILLIIASIFRLIFFKGN